MLFAIVMICVLLGIMIYQAMCEGHWFVAFLLLVAGSIVWSAL